MRSTPHLLAVAAAAALLQATCVAEGQRELQGPIYCLQLSAVLYYLIHAGEGQGGGGGRENARLALSPPPPSLPRAA